MNVDTPLEDVIRFIPPAVAEVLMYQPSELQTWVTTMLRSIMSEWEGNGVHLDPITLEGVLEPVMIQLMACGSTMIEMSAGEG